MDSSLCASADPSNFLVHADANQQSRYKPFAEAISSFLQYIFRLHADYMAHQAVGALG